MNPSPTLLDLYPEIEERWSEGNSLSPGEVTKGKKHQGKNYSCHLTCKEGHSWEITARCAFERGIICPSCNPRGKLQVGLNDLESHCMENNLQGILQEWDGDRNGALTPRVIYYASTQRVWWKCGNGHSWEAPVRSRLPRRGKDTMTQCRDCSLSPRALLQGENLHMSHPELLSQWDYTKNAKDPEHYSQGSRAKIWWICSEGHSWNAEIHSRSVNGNGCPACGNKVVILGHNDLASQNPPLALELSPRNMISPEQILSTSTLPLLWECSSCGGEWEASPHWRSLGWQSCLHCSQSPHSSQVENALRDVLKGLGLDPSPLPVNLHIPWGSRSMLSVDILLEEHRVAVEYDGEYWHRGRVAQDTSKSRALIAAGWRVLRVREMGLPSISEELASISYRELITAPGRVGEVERLGEAIQGILGELWR